MKKLVFIALALMLCGISAYAQLPSAFEAVSKYYRVYSEVSQAHAQETAQKMDAFFELFNSYFHFDGSKLKEKLNVKIFGDKAQYDSYLTAIIGQTKHGFVYLQYSDLKRSELVGFIPDDDTINISLLRHGFIQFLKSFIKNPPLWMQRGFAGFFEKRVPHTNALCSRSKKVLTSIIGEACETVVSFYFFAV